jgi:hypothetical protein
VNGYGQEITIRKILLASRAVKRKSVASHWLHFQAKVEDLHLLVITGKQVQEPKITSSKKV